MSLADIPTITLEKFDRIIEGVIAGMKDLGWGFVAINGERPAGLRGVRVVEHGLEERAPGAEAGGEISPSSRLHPKTMGKAPGRLSQAGWTGVDLNKPEFRCHDRATAELWTRWTANAGFVTGDGFVALDNDQGELLDLIVATVCLKVLGPKVQLLRRFVRDPGHKRSLIVFRVVDFIGDPVAIRNQTLKFDCTGANSELQVPGAGKTVCFALAAPPCDRQKSEPRIATCLQGRPVETAMRVQRFAVGVLNPANFRAATRPTGATF
jgi:hypothetical protein